MEPTGLIIEDQVPIREKVYSQLRERILSGAIPASTRMVEGRLAGMIGASRTPVREALHLLHQEGLLEQIPRVGYRVKPVSWEEVEEIVEIRTVNEILAVTWAMDRITPAEIAALEENLELGRAEIEAGRPESFVRRGAEFHDLLVRASGSQRLSELCQNLRGHMHRYRVGSFHVAETGLRAIEGHRHILDCLKKRDKEAAARAVRVHLAQSKADILRFALRQPGPEAGEEG